MILKNHENILIFYNKQPTFNPQKETRLQKDHRKQKLRITGIFKTTMQKRIVPNCDSELKYTMSVLYFNRGRTEFHPTTQKPVALFEYLIRTYTNENDLVLDNCAGSFTTAIACINSNRNYICMEKEIKYFEIGKERIKNALSQTKLEFSQA